MSHRTGFLTVLQKLTRDVGRVAKSNLIRYAGSKSERDVLYSVKMRSLDSQGHSIGVKQAASEVL